MRIIELKELQTKRTLQNKRNPTVLVTYLLTNQFLQYFWLYIMDVQYTEHEWNSNGIELRFI